MSQKDDLISRKAAIDAISYSEIAFYPGDNEGDCLRRDSDIKQAIMALPSAEPERKKPDHGYMWICPECGLEVHSDFRRCVRCGWDRPSTEPTLYGYNIEHLEMIARVLQKEDLPPERVAELLMDIGRIVAMVRDEFEDTLRKAVDK